MYRYSIIIVTWNALHHLQRFLPSVYAAAPDDCEILIADNASTDGSSEWVEHHYPSVRVVRLDRNYGYCGGNNRAAKQASGDILLFLNNDVEVGRGWLEPIGELFDRDPQLAAAQPRLRDLNHRHYFEYAGAAGGYLDYYGYPFCRGRVFDTLEEDQGQYDTSPDILWASGAALAIRSDLFHRLGGFDEAFEFHMEEIDLCWRLWNRGYRVTFCSRSVVYHLGGGSMATGSSRKTYFNYRNNLFMLIKNLAPKRFPSVLIARMALDHVAVLHALATLRLREAREILRAHLHVVRRRGELEAKRSEQLNKRTSDGEPSVIAGFSVVYQYFIKGRRTFQRLQKATGWKPEP